MRTVATAPGSGVKFAQLERLSVALGAIVILGSALALFGWGMGATLPIQLPAGLPSLNPMTACALIIAGVSLVLQYRPANDEDIDLASTRFLVAKCGATTVLVFGVLVLGDNYLGWDIRADQLLFRNRLVNEISGIPSQTAPGTALCLLLASLSLLCLHTGTRWSARPAELLALAVMFVSLFGIEQYLFGVAHSFSAQIFSSMALHTAVLLQVLALGILCARPREGLMSLATRDYPGAIIVIWGYPLIAVTEIATALFRFEGQASGIFSETLGVTLFTPLNILIIGLLLLWSARLMLNAELRRQHSEDERNRFFELSLDLMCVATTDGYFKQVNTAFLKTLGYSEKELLSHPLLDIVHPDDLNSTTKAMEQLKGGGQVLRFVNRFRCKDGSWRNLSWVSSSAPRDGEIYATARDVTDLMRIEQALTAREEELSITLKSIGDGVLSTDVHGRITRLNSRAEHLTGWSESEALGLPVDTVFCTLNEQTHEPSPLPVISSLSTDATRERINETLLLDRSGEERPIAESCAPIRNREGTVVGAVLTFRDVSEERRAAYKLRAAHEYTRSESERLNIVLDAVVDGVIGFNADGVIHSFNAAAEQLYGYAASDVVGRSIRMLAPTPIQDEFDDYLYNHARTLPHKAHGIGREVHGLHKDGTIFPLEVIIVETAASGEWRFTGVVRDVSERTQFIEDLKSARAQADAANTAKSTFLAAMSHEIRTPINGVIGMLDVLHRTSMKGYQIEMIELIQDSAESLLTIINDILDLSKIEAGKLELQLAPFDVAASVENVCVMMDRFAETLQVELTVFVDPAIPSRLYGDAQHLRQVLINLISNAVKFSKKGRDHHGCVTVRAECVRLEDNQVTLEFKVHDNGIGMDPTTQAHLFTPFEQGKASIGRQFGGTGLGLAISHNLVQLMDGEIAIESVPGAGSTFTVRMPLSIPRDSSDGDEYDAGLDGVTCLVVGVPEGLAPDLTAYLTHDGATVVRADNLEQARSLAGDTVSNECVWVIDAAGQHPTLAQLHGATGSDPALDSRFLAVVIERGRRQNLRRKGPGVYVVDGNAMRRKSLLFAVAVAVGRKSLKEESTDSPVANQRSYTTSISRQKAIECGRLILVAEDNETNQKVIVEQLALLGIAADITSNGLEALELWRNGRYPALMTDLQMPGMDGYELTATIRAEEDEFEHIGIIALTANALSGEEETCLRSGMDSYLSKPSQLEDIDNVLKRWLPQLPLRSPETEPKKTNAQQDSRHPNQPKSSSQPVNVNILRELVGDDPEILHHLLTDFQRTSASTGKEVHAAWNSASFAALGAASHKLKSSARTVGALALGNRCEQIEAAVNEAEFERLEELIASMDQAIADTEQYLQSWRNSNENS